MTPEFPIISIYKDRALFIYNSDKKFRRISTYTFLEQNPDENKLYDKNGNVWTFVFVNANVKDNSLTRLLANTVYNPGINVDLDWKLIGKHNIESLKQDLFNAIDKDKDEIITQFEESETIKSELSSCDSFQQIIDTLIKLVFKNYTADT
jgi:hypothetical protein